MSTKFERTVEFEDAYYAKRSEATLEGIKLRDDGWNEVRSNLGSPESGLASLRKSITVLSGGPLTIMEDGWEDREDCRDVYASVARYAQALCAIGEFEGAGIFATIAHNLTPPGRTDTADTCATGFTPAVSLMPDQYEITFGARLSFAAVAAGDKESVQLAIDLAKKARKLAPYAERPGSVVFIDREMSDKDRQKVASKRKTEARLAQASLFVPSLKVRRKIAQRVCAR